METEEITEVLEENLDENEKLKVSGKRRRPPPTAWKPGESGNPSGRPKNQFSFAKQFRNQFNKKASEIFTTKERALELGIDPGSITVGELFAASIISDSMKGRDSIAKEIINRIDGKVPDVVLDATTDEGLSKLTEEQLMQIINSGKKETEDGSDTDNE
jgi:hypothetical protein